MVASSLLRYMHTSNLRLKGASSPIAIRALNFYVGLFCIGGMIGCGESIDSSSVQCVRPVWDFGTLDPVDVPTVKHTFILKNNTDSAIPIIAKTSCGCMIVNDLPEVIRGMSSVQLTVTTKIAGAPGPFHKTILVQAGTDPPKPLYLVVEGRLLATADVFCVPEIIDFGVVAETQTKARTARIGTYNLSALDVDRIEPKLRGIEASVVQPLSDGILLIELIAVGSELDLGDHKSVIQVYVSGKANPVREIPIRVRRVGGRNDLTDAALDGLSERDELPEVSRASERGNENATTE